MQSEWRHLKSAYANFFKNIKKGVKKGFPRFKSKRSKQSYTTFNINNNCKIDFRKKRLKLPKIKTWILYRDNRIFHEGIHHITVSRNRSGKYFASILIETESNILPKQVIRVDRIIGFDRSAAKFLIAKELELSSPRWYRHEEGKLKKLHRELSRKKKGSCNRNRAKVKLSRLYEKIGNRKLDWVHKLTYCMSWHFERIILENLNVKGMQQFNSGVSKSVTLDFSWNQFINILKYKMEDRGGHLIFVDRYFPSSKLCSACGLKKKDLKLKDRSWTCPNCSTDHDRDINASISIKKESLYLLKQKHITIINNDTAAGTAVDAFGEDVRLMLHQQSSMNYESPPFSEG
ncbi:MAG: RNA-guided endonuclease TnpB family protein [Candidatus Helarchaeota archaeon]